MILLEKKKVTVLKIYQQRIVMIHLLEIESVHFQEIEAKVLVNIHKIHMTTIKVVMVLNFQNLFILKGHID